MIPLRDDNSQRTIPPVVNIGLIAANVLMFFFELSLGGKLNGFMMSAAFVPARYTGGGFGELGPGLRAALLSMFLHGGWGHLLGNMLFLWIFGDNVEDRLGHFRYLVFYLLSGFAATFAHLLANPGSTVAAVGASGAISGVLGAYLFLYPKAPIQTLLILGFFVRLVFVPAWVFLPLWFLMQLLSGVATVGARTTVETGGVAWFAHIGGFIAGPILLFVLGGGRRTVPRPELPY
ncbi:MAG TPA: rhomboid family intramembrane serine protease [Thermoanaerobaculia bacterium]|nr:rhomboid family intramembrane serine protease [Thermoanaerobaculia bacterium]